jgi:hypothetical protein
MQRSRIFLVPLSIGLAGCGPGVNYDQTGIYRDAIQSVLVAKGLCRDALDCSRKEMVLWEGGMFQSSPVHANIYNVSDPSTIASIVEACQEVRPSTKVGVKLRITASKHLATPYKKVRRVTIE